MCQAAAALRQVEPSPATSSAATEVDPVALAEVESRPEWWTRLLRRRAPRRSDAAHRFVLIGTAGGSNPKATRAGIANAVVVDGHAYLVDCGENANSQLWRAGIGMGRFPGTDVALIGSVFITHLHSDHVIDYANLFLGTWPTQMVEVYGPGPAGLPIPVYPPDRAAPPLVNPADPTPGTRAMTQYLLNAFAYNINVRIADEGRPNILERVRIHEIGVRREGYTPDIDLGVQASGTNGSSCPPMEPVEILPTDERGVRVTAILVQHAPVFPAFAYRFDTPHGSVVFSGDTGPCDNLVALATGADYLVHEVLDLEWMSSRLSKLPNREAVLNHLASAHTSPDDVGRIATRAGVGTLVLTHLVPGDGEVTEEEWEAKVRPHFDGEVVCGVDLDEFGLG